MASGSPSTFVKSSSGVTSQDISLTQLPRQITDVQLARLDSLTREAIDERLRILESVSGTVHQCVENLLRVRSALPVEEALNGGFQPHSAHLNSPSAATPPGASTSKEDEPHGARDKGKGVDRGPESLQGEDVTI